MSFLKHKKQKQKNKEKRQWDSRIPNSSAAYLQNELMCMHCKQVKIL